MIFVLKFLKRGTTTIIGTHNIKLNSVALVREGTIPIERKPLVGEVSANV
jgi:hypothetical protein